MDEKLTLSAVLEATGGQLWQPGRPSLAGIHTLPGDKVSHSNSNTGVLVAPAGTLTIEKVVYDSREVSAGTLFVALPGENSDGHLYISQAVANGAAACLVQREWLVRQIDPAPQIAWIAVEETLPAFQRLAAYWRNRFTDLPVIGITGSVGKTSTKELLAAVLGQRFQVFKTPKSVNTEQSILPVLLKLSASDQVAVIEMGAGYVLGELARLCQVARPRIGVVLNVSHSHIGRMGSLDNIALNKSELVRSLPDAANGGIAVLNGDDERVRAMAAVTPARPFFYGTQPEFDLWASEIETFGLAGISFVAHYQGQMRRLRLPLPGRHNVYTALAAAAVGLLSGLGWDEIEKGLADPSARVRLLVLPGLNGSTIIDDSYNASAVSTVAALDLLDNTSLTTAGARKIAVLGDMLELGDFTEEAHRIVGRRVAQVADWLLVVGPFSQTTAQTAIESGFPADRVIVAASKAEIVEWLQAELHNGDCVLVKASRGSGLEEIVEKVRAAR